MSDYITGFGHAFNAKSQNVNPRDKFKIHICFFDVRINTFLSSIKETTKGGYYA
jgi:hypothetical protein